MTNVIKDVLVTNQKIMSKSFHVLRRNPGILIVGIFYMLLLMIGTRLAGMTGILGGIVTTAVLSAVLSSYLFVLNRLIRTGSFKVEDLTDGFRVYFRKIWIMLIIVWIAQYIAAVIGSIFGAIIPGIGVIWLVLYVLGLVLLNPLPEVVYLKHLDELGSFQYAYSFVKENWIDWFIPNIVLIGALWVVNAGIQMAFSMITVGFSIGFKQYFIIVMTSILLQAFISYTMVYRGCLFNVLSTTTRRKRLFMRHINR